MSRMVRSIQQVFEALGDGDARLGRAVLIKLTGKLTQHVTNWLAEGALPRYTYLVVSEELKQRGFQLDPAVCRVTPLPRPRKKRKHKPAQRTAAPSKSSAISQRSQARTSAQ